MADRRQRTAGVFLALVTCLLVAGCGSGSSSAIGTSRVDNDTAQLVAAGVVRLSWGNGAHVADLTIDQMTSIDVLTPPLPACAVAAVGQHPLYFDLNWRSVQNFTRLPSVSLSMATPRATPLIALEPNGQCRALRSFPLGSLPANKGEQLVLQLVGPRLPTVPHLLRVDIDCQSVRLPLVHTCGDKAQPAALTCTVDPVSYVAGSAGS
jgi:hypothetical protein